VITKGTIIEATSSIDTPTAANVAQQERQQQHDVGVDNPSGLLLKEKLNQLKMNIENLYIPISTTFILTLA